jgi:hypothetical protein
MIQDSKTHKEEVQRGRSDFAAGKKDPVYDDQELGRGYRQGWQDARRQQEADTPAFADFISEEPPAAPPHPHSVRPPIVASEDPDFAAWVKAGRPKAPEPAVQAAAPVLPIPPAPEMTATAIIQPPAPVPEAVSPAISVPDPIPEAVIVKKEPEKTDSEEAGADPEQTMLFDMAPDWKEKWAGMPEFDQKDLTPWQSIYVHFRDRKDQKAFSKLIGQTVTDKTRALWYPKAEIGHFVDRHYKTEETINPQFPVYVISKGRADTRLTAKALEKMKVPYHIVIEPQEFAQYSAVIDAAKILQLPFSNLGQGSIPARNWVWEHSISIGAKRHWILDDNIDGFFRLHKNLKVPVSSGVTFKAAEDYVERYENVALAGMQYFMFAPRKSEIPPFALNTRIYSCILIKNDIPYRWRGRYNEDTDLSIRALKDGWCTVLFNAFLAFKQTTMTMAGGNTDELYKDDGRKKMAESLQQQHPDLVKIVWKWGRWQHHVHYKVFKDNRLKLKAGVEIPTADNNYGMNLEKLDGSAVEPGSPGT